MIVYRGEQVIVAGVDLAGAMAVVHRAAALGDSIWVDIEDLRADTIEELEATLAAANVLNS